MNSLITPNLLDVSIFTTFITFEILFSNINPVFHSFVLQLQALARILLSVVSLKDVYSKVQCMGGLDKASIHISMASLQYGLSAAP